jgi:dethiobiotin synthetase
VKGVFVTGTGTGVGKTTVCGLLAGFLRAQGMRVTTQKWVETGATGGPSDIDEHRRLMGDSGTAPEPPLADRCPYRFTLPASPHLAAAYEGRRVDPGVIEAAYRRLAETHDAVVVEGAGGFLVPLSAEMSTGDLVARIGLPVLVVAANRLGCVNDALLTAEAVRRRGILLAGFVFNRLPADGQGRPSAATGRDAPESIVAADNPRIVAEITGAPVLGEVPPLSDPDRGAEAFAPVGRAFLERWRST